MAALEAGAELPGGFTLQRRLGGGAVSETWQVRAPDGSAQVAKLARSGVPESAALLEREARILAELEHPGIAPLLGFEGSAPARLRLPLYPGGTLAALRGAPPERVLLALEAVAAALDHAHERGVVHRDLKLSNVLLDAEGEPHLVDFGVAGRVPSGSDPRPVAGGGSPGSMSPQQASGAPPDPADDQFALGVLAFDLLAGVAPFDAFGLREGQVPPHLPSHLALPGEISALVAALLARDPGDRPGAGEAREVFIEAARRALEATPAAPRPRPLVKLTPPPRPEPIRAQAAGAGGFRPAPLDRTPRSVGPQLAVLLLGLALAAAGAVVFFVLPRWVASQPRAAAADATPVSSPVHPGGPRSSDASPPAPDLGVDPEERAETARARLEPLREQLAERAAERWAAVELAAAEREIAAGDERFAVKDYGAAAEAWERAASALAAILAQAPGALAAALAEGRAALERGDAAGAQAAFARALAIAPEDAGAARGARRGATLDRVLGHLAAAARHEAAADGPAARTEYRAALALDPDADDARRGLARLEAQASQAGFAAALGEALEALEAGDHAAARRGFERAAAIRPGAPQVREGLARVEAAETAEAIARHRERGAALAADEAWREAQDEYEKALARDATLAFARAGRDLARERAELAASLATSIARPERLSADEVLRETRALLLRAAEVAHPGPRHREQVATLERLVEGWSRPVAVRLESDGQTEVTLFRVGRLGRFQQKALELRPGTYTVVGSRRGYRDVRLELEVRPGESPAPLVVRCSEAI